MNIAANILSTDAESRLRAFKRAVEAALPGQVVEMRLFGSRARGDAQEDSDYDVAVFLRNNADQFDVLKLLSETAYEHVLEGYYIRPISLPRDYLQPAGGHRTELAGEIARDGIVIP